MDTKSIWRTARIGLAWGIAFTVGGLAHAQTGQQCALAQRQQISLLSSEITTKENVTLPPDQVAAAVAAIKPLIAQRQGLITQGTGLCSLPCQTDGEQEAAAMKQAAAVAKQISTADLAGADTTSLYQEKAEDQQQAYKWALQKDLDCKPLDSALTGSGTIQPYFMPLFVIYAPPGANNGNSVSTATYGTGAVMESNLSTSNSFTNDFKFSVGFSGGAFGNDASLTLSEDHSATETDSSSADIKETVTDSIEVPGPSTDGVDHDFDRIYVLLNPQVVLTTTPVDTTWSLQHTGPEAHIQYATVGQLKGTQQLSPGLKKDFDMAGLTPAMYPALLALDPFANSATKIDTNRFLLLPTSIPYDPPPVANAKSGYVTHVVTDSEEEAHKSGVDLSNSIGIAVTASVGSPFAQLKMSVESQFTWKLSDSTSQTTGTSQSTQFVIGQPAYGYAGPVDIYVYKDSIFGTYMFTLVPPEGESLLVYGTITGLTGAPARGVPVSLRVGRRSFSTVSGGNGAFRVNGPKSLAAKSATLIVGGKSLGVSLGAKALRRDVRLTPTMTH